MEKYDIFKSEGGYRVCLATYGDDPIIDRCPWCKTLADAKDEAVKAVISAMEKLGYTREYILYRRKDLL